MARHEVDRNRAKIDYFKSKHPTVTEWWKEYAKKNQYKHKMDRVYKACNGWTKEKEVLMQLATEKAQQKAIDETMDTIKELYKPSMEELTKMHKQIMGLVT
jgi:hypothetical protein